MLRNRRFIVFVCSFVLLVSACGGDEAAVTTVATTAAVASTTTTAVVASTTTAVAPTTTVVELTTTEPPPALAPPGSMLITNEEGVFVATLDGVVSQVLDSDAGAVGGIVDFAIDDTQGGILVQPHRSPWFYLGTDSIVYWAPQGSNALQELLVPGADQGLQLEDVVDDGDSVQVYYTRRSGGSPDTAEQTLRRFDFDTRTVAEVIVVGAWESGASPISVGGDTIVASGAGEAFFWLTFADLDGVVFDSPAGVMPDDGFDCMPECFWYGDLSPDGTEVALGRLAQNAGGFPTIPEIEIRDVVTGELVMSVTLPEVPAVGSIDSLDFGDGYVLINLFEEGSVYPFATIVDIASGGLTTYQAPVGGIARFLRSVPDLDGVISWP